MGEPAAGPWDLSLEMVDILREPHCGWNYQVGFKTVWDGRHFPKGMCPFAWNAFSPLIWAMRYGGGQTASSRLGPHEDGLDEMTLVCPDPRHLNVWRIHRIKPGQQASRPAPAPDGRPGGLSKLRLEVSELPRGTGCERGYQVGDSWEYDGDIPQGFCPLAWKALDLWVWALRHGGNPKPMGWASPQVEYNCPIAEHPVVFRIRPLGLAERADDGA